MTIRLRWPTQFGTITQAFGVNPQVYNKFGLPGHEGVDFMAPMNSEIYAAAEGLVSDIRLDGNSDRLGKPYGNQVRVQHTDGYETIYAHLAEVVVTRGELVQSGQLIALADNTGNSTGSHLHFTLKKTGATNAGHTSYPYDIINPTPFLEPFQPGQGGTKPTPPAHATMDVLVESPDLGYLNVRAAPYATAAQIGRVQHKTQLGSLEEIAVTRGKVEQQGQWLWVRLPDGKVGYVAAWYLKLPPAAPPPEPTPPSVYFVIVESPTQPLRLRRGPGTHHPQLAELPHGTALKALEPESTVKQKVGKTNTWLQVQSPAGMTGYVAAWYLKLQTADPEPIVPEPVTAPVRYVAVESPDYGLRVREQPSVNAAQVWWIPHQTVLEILENPESAGHKVGQQEQWLHVRTPTRQEGYVAAWYVRAVRQPDERPATTATLPKGVSPHIFGMHAATLSDDPHTRDAIRGLYAGQAKRGWILFTEICGSNPSALQPNDIVRARLWDWASRGYGVIVRLNHGYEPGGTLPESRHYDGFAAAAARWVELYLKRPELPASDYTWAIQIANEQNNPREHPGGFEQPTEHITAQLYATAFNKAYTRIKAVLPNAIVCPGAIDPYNYMPLKLLNNARWRPLDYYTEMLDSIQALDGIILHAYTHGPDPEAITSLARFAEGSGPLWDHFFDFQIYRLFMEHIPAKWRTLPVYITETNHICRPNAAPLCEHDQGWVAHNTGWVRAMYAEIDRWNRQPYAQQIRCALLYRWMGDAWTISDKPGIQEDFRQALPNDYRWREQGDFTLEDALQPQVAAATPAILATGARAALATAPTETEPPTALPPIEERVFAGPDNFKAIWGLGVKSEEMLNAAGVYLYTQLAAMEPEQLQALLGETELRTRYLETWPKQARMLLENRESALLDLQRGLGRGRAR